MGPITNDDNCLICLNSLSNTETYENQTDNKPTYLGKAIKVTCCNQQMHEACVLKSLNTVNDTPADYGNFSSSMIRDLNNGGYNVDDLVQRDATANATKNENCPCCRKRIESFLLPDSPDDNKGNERPINDLDQLVKNGEQLLEENIRKSNQHSERLKFSNIKLTKKVQFSNNFLKSE